MQRSVLTRPDGTRCVYRTTGDGPVVVLLHGFTMTAQMWEDNGTVAKLKGRYRLVLPDFVGHGDSDKPYEPAAYGLRYLDDIGALLDQENAQSAALVGFSMGAELALAFAATYAPRVRALFLMGSGWSPPEAAEIYAQYADWLHTMPEEERPAHWDARAFSALVKATGEAMGIPREKIAAINAPVEGLVGGDDPERPYLERLQGVLPNFTLRIMDGIPHETSWRQREVPVRVADFLGLAFRATEQPARQ